ncbi:MAG TPA: glutaredoxin 3 [Kofleriaceae bacterium]|nr:glutaredoxin 3 [Kofleriaceae bacterium]
MAAQVTIYTRQWCGYCSAAERLLKNKGVAFENIDLTGDNARRKWLADLTGRTTVPQIFIGGQAIGGFDDMNALERAGKLDALLAGPGSGENPKPPR